MLLLIKLTLAPALVAATTLAGRRWGPRVAGWVGGMPVVVGPILLALTIEHDSDFGARAAAGALAGLLSLTVFMVTYAWTARKMRWPAALLVSWLTYSAGVAALDQVTIDPLLALPLVLITFAVAARAMPNDPHAPDPPKPPAWDIPVRLIATAGLVLA
ncbi:MAG: hypothetical protein ABWZ63_04630, partial [Thermoleophilaceae bacterium]